LIRALIGMVPFSGSLTRSKGLRLGYTPQKLPLEQLIPMPVDRFIALSDGETQRVLLARALMRQPDLLILDEPTQGLDSPGEARFYQLLSDIRTETGVAVFMVSHDLHMVMAQSDRVICLNQHICCSGTLAMVAENPNYLQLSGPVPALPPTSTTTTSIATMIDPFLLKATLAGLLVAWVAAPLGCLVVWRRMAYFGDATGHAALLGVALAMKLVGILLITAMLILPAAAAARLARSPERMVAISALIGSTSVLGGLWLSWEADTPAGPSIIVVASVVFVFSALRPRTN